MPGIIVNVIINVQLPMSHNLNCILYTYSSN